jgi:hypothetical protein
VEGAEDLEVIAAARSDRAGGDDRRAGMGAKGDPLVLTGPLQAQLAPLGVGAPIGADVELAGVAIPCQRQRLGDWVAVADVEPPAGTTQRFAEVA